LPELLLSSDHAGAADEPATDIGAGDVLAEDKDWNSARISDMSTSGQ